MTDRQANVKAKVIKHLIVWTLTYTKIITSFW